MTRPLCSRIMRAIRAWGHGATRPPAGPGTAVWYPLRFLLDMWRPRHPTKSRRAACRGGRAVGPRQDSDRAAPAHTPGRDDRRRRRDNPVPDRADPVDRAFLHVDPAPGAFLPPHMMTIPVELVSAYTRIEIQGVDVSILSVSQRGATGRSRFSLLPPFLVQAQLLSCPQKRASA